MSPCWLGKVRLGVAGHGWVRLGEAVEGWHGLARRGEARLGPVWPGKAGLGIAGKEVMANAPNRIRQGRGSGRQLNQPKG